MTQGCRKFSLQAIVLLFSGTFLFSDFAAAQVQVGVTFNESQTHAERQTRNNRVLGGSFSLGLNRYIRLGFSRRVELEQVSGHRLIGQSQTQYEEFSTRTEATRDSLDLFVIVYQGIVTPYVFGGIARKTYVHEVRYEFTTFNETIKYKPSSDATKPVWNAGVGFAIPLNRNFSVRISRSWSEGRSVNIEGEERKVLDTYTDVSLNYQL